MMRSFALTFGAGLALLAASVCSADEPTAVVHNDPITVRILGGNGHGVERRVDDPDVAALGLDREQVLVAPRDPQHVAERAKGHIGPGGDH